MLLAANTPRGPPTNHRRLGRHTSRTNWTKPKRGASRILRVVRSQNRVIPAYPQVSLSPTTLETLAGQPSVMKPLAEVAAHLTSPDRWPWPRQPATLGIVTFRVCGGLTNQRLALLDGLMIAALLNFTAVAPQLNANGLQTGVSYAEPLKKLVNFSIFFDGAATARALRGVPDLLTDDRRLSAMVAWAEARGSKAVVYGTRARPPSFFTNLAAEGARHISIESCAMNLLNKKGDASLEQLFWKVDAALVPAPAITDAASRVIAALRADSLARGGAGAYTALHMRVETDWIEHCKRWERGGGANCFTNTDNLDRVFAIEGVPKELPVYVAVEHIGAPPRSAAEYAQVRGLRQLADQGYALCGKTMLLAEGELVGREREWLAAVDYAVGRAAARVVGNSVSTFSALQLLRRQHEGADHGENDFHYNGGDVPLASVLWGAQRQRRRPLKWVFTIHSNSSNSFNEMARVAVASALQHTTLIPVCIFYGRENPLSAWMRTAKGVRFVAHKPAWRHKLKQAWRTTRALELGNVSSTNYKSLTALLATHLRIDVPVAPASQYYTLNLPGHPGFPLLVCMPLHTLLQPPLYPSPSRTQILGFVDEYVFYADVDVMFVRDIDLATFAPLPAFFAVATDTDKLVAVRKFKSAGRLSLCDPEPTPSKHSTDGSRAAVATFRATVPCMGEVDYGNAGVMLINVERMRRTHAEFVRFIFSEQVVATGMDHGVYGPADQGAYNKFFAGRFDVHLEASWNWKPYWGHAANVSLVHFHGPKPHEYFAHIANNTGLHKTFRELFYRCDKVDRENAALRPRQPGCMAYSHSYAKELAKVLQVQPA